MSASRSSEKFDYSLRMNKNIERKLIFGKLKELSKELDYSTYRYMGFGGLWFVDFILAHRLLGINQLWSLEDKLAQRAEYNKPYSCIEVKPLSCSAQIRAMSPEDWQIPQVIWLDYDGRFDQDVLDDCIYITQHCAANSILIITSNANKSSYKSPEISAVNYLQNLFGDSLESELLIEETNDITAAQFPKLLATSTMNLLSNTVLQSARTTGGENDRFVPLFNFVYQDNSPMFTAGGLIASSAKLTAIAPLIHDGELVDCLDLIPITLKEKLSLDSLLPCTEAQFTSEIDRLGIKIAVEDANKYRRLYKHFPMFSELSI